MVKHYTHQSEDLWLRADYSSSSGSSPGGPVWLLLQQNEHQFILQSDVLFCCCCCYHLKPYWGGKFKLVYIEKTMLSWRQLVCANHRPRLPSLLRFSSPHCLICCAVNTINQHFHIVHIVLLDEHRECLWTTLTHSKCQIFQRKSAKMLCKQVLELSGKTKSIWQRQQPQPLWHRR